MEVELKLELGSCEEVLPFLVHPTICIYLSALVLATWFFPFLLHSNEFGMNVITSGYHLYHIFLATASTAI